MPGLTTVTINDRASTPVAHTFVPENLSNGEGFLVERRSNGSYVGEPKLSAGNHVTPSRRAKAKMRLVIPKVVSETINGVTVEKVVDTSYITLTLDWGSQFTDSERDVILGMVENATKNRTSQPFLNRVLCVVDRVYG